MKDLKSLLGSNLDADSLSTLKELKEKRDSGEKLNKNTEEALKALDMASEIMDSIMSGRQIDLGYFKIYLNRINKIMLEEKKEPQKKLLNNRKRRRAKKSNK